MKLSLFLITLLFFLITPSHAVSILTYNETETNLEIIRTLNYKNEMVICLVRLIDGSENSNLCLDPKIELRWVHQDNTIEANTVDFQFPEFNFCPGPNGLYPFDIFKLLPDLILIIYANPANANFYGLIIDKLGKFISESYLAPIPVINGEFYPNFVVEKYFRANEEKNFVFAYYDTETSLTWKTFILDDNKNINELNNGILYLNEPFGRYRIFPGINNIFAFVNYSTTSSDDPNNPNKKTVEASITYITPDINNKTFGPFMLYRSTMPNLDIDNIYCSFRESDSYFCLMSIINNQTTSYSTKISFLYPSTIISIEEFFDLGSFNYTYYLFDNLIYGDIMFEIVSDQKNNNLSKLTGLRIGVDGTLKNYFLKNFTVSDNFGIIEYKNGVANLVMKEGNFTLKIISFPLEDPVTHPYGIPEVLTTYPAIDSQILPSTTTINITYNLPIMFSNKNIYIYQNISGVPFLRQSIPGNRFGNITYSNESRTISFDILSSTFNKPDADYFVVVDDDAIKNKNNDQPLVGIEKGFWKFRTGSLESKHADDAVGRFALDHDGSMKFGSRKDEDRLEFLLQLRLNLAKVLSVDLDRLDYIKLKNMELHDEKLTVTFLLTIKATDNKFDRSVIDLVNDLDQLIRNKNLTMIAWFNNTNYIRSDFGFQLYRSIFEVYFVKILIIGLSIIPLGFLWWWAHIQNPTGQSYAALKLILIVSDVVLDIMFIVQNSTRVDNLLWPSIVFTVLPMIINIGFGSLILMWEMGSNARFRIHMMRHTTVASIFTVLAITDIEALTILSSRFAGMKCFGASISGRTRKYIWWLSWVGLFLEDVPQLVIQAVYEKSVTEYDFVPFLTLSVTIASFSVNFVNKYLECLSNHDFIVINDNDDEDDESEVRLVITDNKNSRTYITISRDEGTKTALEIAEELGITSMAGQASGSESTSVEASGSSVRTRSSGLRIRTP